MELTIFSVKVNVGVQGREKCKMVPRFPAASVSQCSRSVMSYPWQPWGCITPGFPVHHQLPKLAETHVHGVGDAVQPSHPLLSPSPAFSLPQHQGLFQ